MEHKPEFIKLCREVVAGVERDEMSIENACHKIGGEIFKKDLKDNQELIGIIEEALDLELGVTFVGSALNDRWEVLKEKIKNL